MACYRKGGCGQYEMLSCDECPASKKEYLDKDIKEEKIFVVTIEGEVKDNHMAIGKTEEIAKENALKAYFKETGHTEEELENECGC